jgi:hypothetical protein
MLDSVKKSIFFHAGITFFHAGGCSVTKNNSIVKKSNFSVKKRFFFHAGITFFHAGEEVMISRIRMSRGGWELI